MRAVLRRCERERPGPRVWGAGPGPSFERLLAFWLVELGMRLPLPRPNKSRCLCDYLVASTALLGRRRRRARSQISMWAAPAALVVGAVGVWRAVSQRRAVPPQTPAQQEKAAGEELLAEEWAAAEEEVVGDSPEVRRLLSRAGSSPEVQIVRLELRGPSAM